MHSNRRDFLRTVATSAGATAALSMFPAALRKALAIPAHRRTGTLQDVEHIVIFMQENRSFDHYFGTLNGVRGFGDRFPIPVPDAPGIDKNTVWYQSTGELEQPVLAPFHLNTQQSFEYMRVSGTPHTWPNAQNAWNHGSLDQWPRYKTNHSLGYFSEGDLPFQFAMANAFTLCDAYHCSFQGGTNPNRVFAFTGCNDPLGSGHGPVTTNDYDNFAHDPDGGYSWTSYCERLEAAGIRWQVYENMEDNFTDNPLAGFRSFRAARRGMSGSLAALKHRGVSTRDLDRLKDDVRDGVLPQVSWIVATAEGSEHPGPSSPAQGAAYTARVLEALTENPEVWSKTVLLLMFDENDGFFDHVPPPAAPSYLRYAADRADAVLAGDSTVDTTGEYHELIGDTQDPELTALQHRPYGLGPRVPLYVLSPWSKGGFVNSQVFDHTSIIRFVEQRFGVHEPNITAWRRAVCGDLTSTLDFEAADEGDFYQELPETGRLAERARALTATTVPATPETLKLPEQDFGTRPSRALPYSLHVTSDVDATSSSIALLFESHGQSGAVFHVYDRLHLERPPRRYTVESGKQLSGRYSTRADDGAYDLWVLGPNGFHRHFTGHTQLGQALGSPEVRVGYDSALGNVYLVIRNPRGRAHTFTIRCNAYFEEGPARVLVAANAQHAHYWWLVRSGHWYDFTMSIDGVPGYSRRFAGRVETGRASISDPAMGGLARAAQVRV
ncbi:MAG: Twin-arginine translocation pathway signal [Myxococcaceae bacterium]|nr:Twin-arginine translocation pathway signal [Myxococcaceae bacterium]